MKSILLLALVVFVLSVIAGCKAPDANAGPKDSTSKAMKQAGGDE
jgi:hypothetical protein